MGEGLQVAVREAVGVGATGDVTAQAAVHIFDAAFLPRAVRVAEVGFQAGVVKPVVKRELRSVVVRERPAQPPGHGGEPFLEAVRDGRGVLSGLFGQKGIAG